MSPKKWIEATDAIGIVSKSGRYGGTYAYSDIAFEFASWISPEFKLYIIKDYKRLKAEENSWLSLKRNLNRELSKLNYRIHTDAIKVNLIPPELTLCKFLIHMPVRQIHLMSYCLARQRNMALISMVWCLMSKSIFRSDCRY